MQSDLRWSEHLGRLWSCGSFHLVWGLHAKLLCSLLLSLHQGTQSQPSEFRLDQQLHCQLLPATLPNLPNLPNLPISFHLFSVFPHHIFSFLIQGSLGKPVLDASTHLPVTRSQPPSLGFHPVPCPEKKRPIQTYSIYSCFLIFLIFLIFSIFLFILLKPSLLNLSRGPCLSCWVNLQEIYGPHTLQTKNILTCYTCCIQRTFGGLAHHPPQLSFRLMASSPPDSHWPSSGFNQASNMSSVFPTCSSLSLSLSLFLLWRPVLFGHWEQEDLLWTSNGRDTLKFWWETHITNHFWSYLSVQFSTTDNQVRLFEVLNRRWRTTQKHVQLWQLHCISFDFPVQFTRLQECFDMQNYVLGLQMLAIWQNHKRAANQTLLNRIHVRIALTGWIVSWSAVCGTNPENTWKHKHTLAVYVQNTGTWVIQQKLWSFALACNSWSFWFYP